MKHNDKSDSGKIITFIRASKTNSPIAESGSTSLPPIGDRFVSIDTSGINFGPNAFVRFERINFIQISNKSL